MQAALFVTLTYPKEEPAQADHQRHRDALLKRLRRKAPESSALWKLEYTKANTPHFHLLIFNLAFWHHKEIAKAWSEIVRSDNPHHLAAGIQVNRVLSQTHVAKYIVKYFAKSSPLPTTHVGRIWGISGAIRHAISPKKIFIVTKKTYFQIRRTFDQLRKAQARNRTFKRAWNIKQRQRWFLRSPAIIAFLQYLQCPEIPTHPPPNPAT